MFDIEKAFVPKDIAIELRDLGFDEFCLFYYEHNKPAPRFGLESRDIKNKSHFRIMTINAHKILKLKSNKFDIAAPSYEQVFTWFRKKGLFHSIILTKDFIENDIFFSCEIRNVDTDIVTMFSSNTYEEAKIDSIKILIDIYKNQKINEILRYKIQNALKTINLPYLDVEDYEEYVEIISPRFIFYMNNEGYQRTMKKVLTKEIDKYVKNTRNT